MPAGPIGSVWAAGTWTDVCWEADTWADAAAVVAPTEQFGPRRMRVPARETTMRVPPRSTTMRVPG
jgi:hypothetical protein